MADEEGYGKKTGKVPLSFFAVGDSSDSESESEDEEVVQTPMVSRSTDAKVVLPKSKLPSPQTLFATVGRPAFLNSAKDKDADVDWNSLSKRYESSFSSRSQVEYFAPPAPVSLTSAAEDEYDDAVVSSAPVKYKKQATEIQKHMIVHQKRAADIRVLDLQKQDGQSGKHSFYTCISL